MKKKQTSNQVLEADWRRLTNAVTLTDELTFLLWQKWKHSLRIKPLTRMPTRRMYERLMPGIQVAFGPKAREIATLVSQAQANLDKLAKEKAKE